MTYEEVRTLLEEEGQGHVLQYWDELDDAQRQALLAQVSALDMPSIRFMRETLATQSEGGTHGDMAPAEVVRAAELADPGYRERGEALLRDGRAGAILVAGGQGSRLGFDGPKGAYRIGPVSDASLFEIHAHKILALEKRYDTEMPFYIMTSQVNDAPTRAFFEENDHFGLAPDRVKFFTQGMWPALSPEGKLMMDRPDHLFMSPDGHGGTLTALKVNGMLDDMASRGVDTLFYFQVDNPLIEICDPTFLGIHAARDAEISVKVCAKRDANEGLGVVVVRDGRCSVVEYTELTEEQKHACRPNGELEFLFGSVAIHVFSRAFLEQEAAAQLPLHVAHKKVPYWGPGEGTVKPDAPNAYKFEKFIFDAIPDAERPLNVEFLRGEEFSPVKNATGNDSPATTQRDMTLKFARWLEACGVAIARDADDVPLHRIEIDPCYALDADELKARLPAGFELSGDVYLA